MSDDLDLDHDDALDPVPPALLRSGPRRRRFRNVVPLRIVLPNLITLLSLCLGLTAIRYATEGHFERAVFFIVAAAVFDGVDGRLARALKGTTRFGAELDSLADFVDFGVAPALTLYFWNMHEFKSFGWFAAMVFAIAMALRLARFNARLDDPDKPAWASNFFTGMPAPAGAITALLPLYLHLSALGWVFERWAVALEIAYLLGIAALMASTIPHFSGKSIRVPREQVIPVLFGVAVFVLLLATFPMEVLAGVVILFLALIPFSVRSYRRYVRRDAGRAQTPAA
ncbi:CDP-alcohol phosphatidyltransferase family protein [Lichenibacterium dinghuense]|uniref:CDP-alcohol phosphatidyltransferase family protein n=1 Tax=Lichenibacterium dinghuense TaxID=2895977 RepID=UPI001F185FF7|nr:phosphatidylcholine/phosphatidylserine synthase [Lichenibacterium sp. 6Y81]